MTESILPWTRRSALADPDDRPASRRFNLAKAAAMFAAIASTVAIQILGALPTLGAVAAVSLIATPAFAGPNDCPDPNMGTPNPAYFAGNDGKGGTYCWIGPDVGQGGLFLVPDSDYVPPTYPCWDGSTVTNPANCPVQPTYPCWDGSTVTNPANCPVQPTYPCWDGSTVTNPANCPVQPDPCEGYSTPSIEGAFTMAATRGQTATRSVSAGAYVYVTSHPSQGSASTSGYTVMYTPAASGASSVTFTIAADNSCYRSASRTVTVNISEAAPGATDYVGATDYNADLTFTPSVSGVVSGLTVLTQPAHGAAVSNGTTITYSPAPGHSGPDIFNWRSDGPGGFSQTRTASITVRPPATPTVSGGTINTAYNQSGSLTLTAANYDTLVIETPPSNGTATLVGKVLDYTSTNYIGTETLIVAAEGPGGRATASITVNVAPPPAPVASGGSITTPYQTPVSFALPATGIVSSFSLGAETNGTASLSGTDVTFTPPSGFFGVGGVDYTVIGPGGSATGHFVVNVAVPGAPVVQDAAASTPQNTPVKVNLVATGAFTSLEIVAAPGKGNAVINGAVATYTPAPAWIGQDKFFVIAKGVGPDSAPAEVTIDVTAIPPPPVVQPPAEPAPVAAPQVKEGAKGKPVVFNITPGSGQKSNLLRGGASAMAMETPGHVELVNQPPVGSAQVSGFDVIFSPPAEYVGSAKFDYRIINAKGAASNPASLTAIIGDAPVPAPLLTGSGWQGKTIIVDLNAGATGGPFTAARLVSMSPHGAGEASISEVGPGRYALNFKSVGLFKGDVELLYTLSNGIKESIPGLVRLTVNERPDPGRDPEVVGLVNAEANTLRRFNDVQTSNTNRYMEVRRRAGPGSQVNLALVPANPTAEFFEDPIKARAKEVTIGGPAPVAAAANGEDPRPAHNQVEDRKVSVWAAGALELGSRKGRNERAKVSFETGGLSAGADVAINDNAFVGAGVGYGHDVSDVGDKGTRSEATGKSAFVYGSYSSDGRGYVDGVLGLTQVDFDSVRYVTETGRMVSGSRNGNAIFGSLSGGYLYELSSGWDLTPYGRLEMSLGKLGAFSEAGDDTFALTFREHSVDNMTGVLGVKGDYRLKMWGGELVPTFRAEYRRTIRDSGSPLVSYADWADSPLYQVNLAAYESNALVLGTGLNWFSLGSWTFTMDAEGSVLNRDGRSIRLRFGGSGKF